ncbi:MAG: glutamate--cysteine ligase, partial [Arenimonas sp.]
MADTDSPRITGKDQLVAFHASGARAPQDWRIGTEHEKFGFRLDDLRPPSYEGEQGIGALLKGLTRFGWQPVEEGGDELGIGFLGMGFQPKWARSDMPWMPKGRYKIMREYMPKVGTLGLDMMTRTCTVQTNLDFENEADMVKKFRVSLALQPVATALFADSPFTEGKPNGYLSYRSHIWTDTDPDRTGMLDFVFEDGFGFESYVDYLLDVPMYFAYRDKKYIDCAGLSFRDFLNGKLAPLPGELPTLADWSEHMTTAFPEVRLKKYLEMRGADG